MIESKKTEKADLTNKSMFFFSIGLFTAVLTTVLVFEHKTVDEGVDLTASRNTDQMDEIIEVPPTDHLPPPPPPAQQPHIVEIPDEEEIEEEIEVNLDAELTEETKVEHIEIKHEKEDVENVDEIFTIVEELASPVGGMTAFHKFVAEHMKYPQQARRMAVEGKVYCSFVVNRDGTIQDVKVVRGLGAGCDEEAVRVIGLAPPWNPSKQRGKAVRSRFHLFITFRMH
jgi:protein TonB